VDNAEQTISTDDAPDQYAVVEIFGHRSHAGRVREVEQYGTKMLRIDVPKDGDFEAGFTSHFYGGASIFSMTPCDLATVVRANKPYQPAALLSYADEDEDEDDGEHPF
jgi:hypothetical protein